MPHRRWIAAAVVVFSVALLAVAAEPPAKKSGGLPPLRVDRSAPRLVDEAPAKPPASPDDAPVADNSACFVCHGNFQEESLVSVHAKENVGCMKCHGESVAHRNDEDNITPPDVMFPAAKIDASCHRCHEDHNVTATKIIASWQKHCPAKSDPKTIVCTDCHGEHRIKVRNVLWDKETKKLISHKKDETKKPAATSKAERPFQTTGKGRE